MRAIQLFLVTSLLAACGDDDPTPVDADGDGFLAEDDCDDNDPAVNPDAQDT